VNLASAVAHLEFTNVTVAVIKHASKLEGGALLAKSLQICFKSVGVQTVILGHSSEELFFHESSMLLSPIK
jgi:triosephosphate isomerase